MCDADDIMPEAFVLVYRHMSELAEIEILIAGFEGRLGEETAFCRAPH
jgi:hypothetical protein